MKNFILILFIFNSLLFSSQKIDLENKKIEIVDEKDKILKTKEDYEKKPDLLKRPVEKLEKEKKKESTKLNGNVGINKDTRTLDRVNVNMGKNF